MLTIQGTNLSRILLIVSIRSVAREMLGTIDQLIMDHFGQTWHTLDALYPNQNYANVFTHQNEIHSG